MVRRWVPDRRDIIWIDFDLQVGREMKSRHPMMILSPRIVNDATSIVVGLPMSTQEYNASNPFAVALHAKDGSTGYIIANQPKSFDWRLRNAKVHPWKQAPEDVFESVCEKLNRIISICSE